MKEMGTGSIHVKGVRESKYMEMRTGLAEWLWSPSATHRRQMQLRALPTLSLGEDIKESNQDELLGSTA